MVGEEARGGALRVGLFGIGLDTYWPQFTGLEERLKGYLAKVEGKLRRPGVEVVSLGLIDSPEKAAVAGHRFRQADVDLIFLYVTTYALSATVLPVVRRAKVPVIVLNLSPAAAIDYAWFNALGDRTKMTGEWLAYCQACSVPEIANVFKRAGISFHQITGMLDDDPQAWDEISDWIDAARVAYVMEHNRLGIMGHYYGGMLDIYSDLTQQCAGFGGHVEIVEVDELASRRAGATAAEVEERVGHFRQVFDVQPDCPEAELERAARTSVALDRLVEAHDLGSLAYYYMGVGNPPNEDAISSIILGNSLLTARGVPMAGEMEIKNVQAMKILDTFGVGGSFTEYYAMDFKDDVVLMGHDGPGHLADLGGQDQGPAAPRLSRQGGPGPFRGDDGEARPHHRALGGADGRPEAQAAGGGGRVGGGTHPGDREHEQPLSVPARGPRLRERLERARSGPSLRRRGGPRGREDREAGQPSGHGSREGLLERPSPQEVHWKTRRTRLSECCCMPSAAWPRPASTSPTSG